MADFLLDSLYFAGAGCSSQNRKLRLLKTWYPRTNDSGLHYYSVKQTNPSPLFYLTEDGKGEAVE